MRVAIVGSPFSAIPPKKYGGIEVVIAGLIKGLKEEGHEPILLGTEDSKVDCELIPIAEKGIFFPKESYKVKDFERKIKQIHDKTSKILQKLTSEVDIIHSHGFDMRKFADFPHVITLHNPFLLQGRDFYFNPLSVQYFEERRKLNYISISKNQRMGSPFLNYIANVYNGEDPKNFPIVTKPGNYVCFLGRFDPDKYPHLAIQLAINKKIKIKIAGKIDFEGEHYFEKEIKPFLKHPLVEYLGEIGFEEKVKLISNSKCNLHPTGFREPFGLTVIEAAYCGTPTLAIKRGSMPELIQNGLTGILVEDFVEAYHQLDKCFKMNRRYTALRTRLKFNYRKMTRGYIEAYKKVLHANSTKK